VTDSCYHIANDLKLPQSGAIEVCWKDGGYLALILDDAERDAVQAHLDDADWLWIDGSDTEQEGTWKRHTGEKLPKVPFAAPDWEEPNGAKQENCLIICYDLLGDWACADVLRALCKMDKSK